MRILFAISSFFYCAVTYSQVDTLDIHPTKYCSNKTERLAKYGRMITLYYLGYPVKKDSVYEFVYEEVAESAYKAYIKRWEDYSQCLPCWQRHYDENGAIVSEGFFKTDCIIGTYKIYDSVGRLKAIHHYKEVNKPLKCSMKHGEWIYYEKGIKKKSEIYKDDELVATIVY
jgi:hypothetical protein